jgi:hypothetical protein
MISRRASSTVRGIRSGRPGYLSYRAVVAELDYAFLAEYAQITNGNLTAVNASFINIKTAVPTAVPLAIAGRVRAPADAGEIKMNITFTTPSDNGPTISFQLNLNTEGNPVYDNKVGILFAMRSAVPVPTHGLYLFTIDIDGEKVRTLAFEAVPL